MASMLLFLALLHFFPVGVAGLESLTSAKTEIVFLVDGSWSIGRPNFRPVRHFLGSVVDAFDIGPDKVQIAVAQYSGTPRTEWHLNSYSTKQTLMDAIARLPYKGGNTLTGTALNFTLSNHFNAQAGLRPGAHKIVVLITDGKSQDDVKAPTARVKEAGVELFAVGIKNHDVTELREISSDPAETHVYSVRDFSLLGDIVDDLTNNLRNSIKGFSQPHLTQPASKSVSLGQTAKLSCTSSSVGSWGNFNWYQQRPGQIPHLLVYGTTDRVAGIPDHFTGSSSESIGYLTITNIQPEDEAHYYCAALESTYGNKWIFGDGTQLTVTGQPAAPPTVHLFPPSSDELTSKSKGTLVCLVDDFTPGAIDVTWLADGSPITSNVETTRPTKRNDKYVASSYLSLTAAEYEKKSEYTCKVTHDGKSYQKSVQREACSA